MAKSMMHIASEKPELGAVQKCVGSFGILFSSPKGARVLRRTQTAKLESRLCVFLRETSFYRTATPGRINDLLTKRRLSLVRCR